MRHDPRRDRRRRHRHAHLRRARPPVNTMTRAWQHDLADAGRAARGRRRAHHAASCSRRRKPTFFAGADLKNALRLQADDARARLRARSRRLKKKLRRLETLRQAGRRRAQRRGARRRLGGRAGLPPPRRARRRRRSARPARGHARPASPARGGITRLSRLLGLHGRAAVHPAKASCSAPREALELGLVRRAGDSAEEPARAGAGLDRCQPATRSSRGTRKDYRMPGGTPAQPEDRRSCSPSRRRCCAAEDARPLPGATQAMLAAMVEGALVDFDTALRIESALPRGLRRCRPGREEHDQHVLLRPARDQARRVAAARRAALAAGKVGVLGAGMMGAGIAYVRGQRGIDAC